MTAADAHPPIHVLADLAEGVLDDATTREVRAHVEQCDTCQATLDELAGLTVALRGLPAELPVPEFVAARISHALAAEWSSGGVATAAGSSPGGAEGGPVAWFRRRLPQGLAAAASIAVVGLAGYGVVSGGLGNGGSDESAADSAAVAEDGGEVASGGGDSAAQDPSRGTLIDPPDNDGTTRPVEPRFETHEVPAVGEADLTAAAQEVVAEESRIKLGCGQVLSAELDLPLVGSKYVGSGVLVVLDNTDSYAGWLIDTCNSFSSSAIVPHVDVPKAE